jgi:hypothetical protein
MHTSYKTEELKRTLDRPEQVNVDVRIILK